MTGEISTRELMRELNVIKFSIKNNGSGPKTKTTTIRMMMANKNSNYSG